MPIRSAVALVVLALAACSHPVSESTSGTSAGTSAGSAAGTSGSGTGSSSGSAGTTGSSGSTGGTTGASTGGCSQQAACTPTNICDDGKIDCGTGGVVCKDQGTANAAQTGVTCAPLATCQGTQCLQANWPLIPNNDGGVLATPNLVLLNYSDDTNAKSLQADAAWVIDGGFIVKVAGQYGVGSGSTQLVNLGLSSTAPTGTNTNFNAFPQYFQSLFDSGTLPAYAPNDFYVLYLPANWADAPVFCQSAGGYHTNFQDNLGNNVPYAIVPDCSAGQTGGLEELEIAATHEIVEGTTDPFGTGWVFGDRNSPSSYLGGEVGDMCESYQSFYSSPGGTFAAPFIYSNAAITAGDVPCQPWPFGTAYVSVLAPATMATALPGTAAQVTVTGWASAPYPPWGVQAIDDPIGAADYPSSPSVAATTLSPGEQTTVSLQVPSTAMGGQHGVAWVMCFDQNKNQSLGAAMIGVTAGCTASSACADPQTVCDLDAGSGIGNCAENPCASNAAPFSTCNGQGVADGVCIPNDFGKGPVELCSQAGTLPTGATNCAEYTRTGDGGTANYCSNTSYCFGFNTPTCLGLCLYDGGAGSCAAGSDCLEQDQYFGVCTLDCTDGGTCPGGQTCYQIGPAQSACIP